MTSIYAKVDLESEVHQTIRSAAEWVDIQVHRNAPGSAYVPRHGDSRYRKEAA